MVVAVIRSPRRCLPPGLVWACSAAVLLCAGGCTICPDPFDYSGPVPNGTAPQNDFRARSNGIAPTGGVPRPWPPVVQAAPPADDPPVATTAAETDAAEPPAGADGIILPAAAEQPEGRDEATAPEAPVDEAPALEEILPPAAPTLPQRGPGPRETPGWRSRD